MCIPYIENHVQGLGIWICMYFCAPYTCMAQVSWLQHMESHIFVIYSILMCESHIPPRLSIFIKAPYMCSKNKILL
jgi:hypothetical protein